MTRPAANEMADWVAHLSYSDIPAEVVDSAITRIMDILGICVAARESDAGTAARAVAEEWLPGRREATLVGEPLKVPAAIAAMVNGTYAHSLDFDDTHLPSVVHPSAPMVPAVLAQAEAVGADGKELLTALVAAYELNIRLAMAQFDAALGNSVFFERGFHATSILGTIAAAAACSRLRGHGVDRIADAIAIACSMGAGLIEANRSGGSIKKFHGGWAAHGAVTAAALAEHGLTGPPTALEGRFGLFQAYCGESWNRAALTDGLGTRWDTPTIHYKAYPCNHFTHAIVDAAIALRSRGVEVADIEHVTIGTAEASWRTIGDPIALKRAPATPYQAAFSAPYVFATALVGGSGLGVSADDFREEVLHEDTRKRIAEVCDVVIDPECTRLFPYEFAAIVRVSTRSQGEVVEEVLTTRGGPSRPLSREDLFDKLHQNAGSSGDAIAHACASLPELRSLEALFAATCSPASSAFARSHDG